VNILLHGVNGYLTYTLGRELGESSRVAATAGLLWLTFPGAVEAVTWLSGLQDVLMTFLVMCFLVSGLRGRVFFALGCLVLATFTKESAVCGPVLLLVLRIRRDVPLSLLAMSAAWSLLFGLARLYLKPPEGFFQPLTPYFVKEFISGLFGSLAMPFTREQMFEYPILVSTLLVAFAVMMAALIGRLRDRPLWTGSAALAAWGLIAALPVYGYFHISPDLQGTRYLYLPAVGWSLLMGSLSSRSQHSVSRLALAVLIGGSCVGTILHQQRWREAAGHRDAVLLQATERARALGCLNARFQGGPDSYAGVYVFRNGISEATSRMGLSRDDAPVDCLFEWQRDDFVATHMSGKVR
jgi:hypothetical protein